MMFKKLKEYLSVDYEQFMLYFGLCSPIFTIPQLIKVYFTHSHHVAGLSLLAWVAYTIVSASWAIYGIIYNKKAIIAANSLACVLNAIISVGIVYYGGAKL